MKTALGKGLGALIPDKGQEVMEIEITRITANAGQPRKNFDEAALKDLSDSIKEKGVIQPIIVRRGESGTFMIIAGERRYRASQLAGLKKIPALVRQADEEDALEIALIENIQREDLNPVETARAYKKLMDQFSLTQEQVAAKVGKDRATVANYMRLLSLPKEVLALVIKGTLTMGHARALLTIEDEAQLIAAVRQVVAEGLNVRQTEKLAKTPVVKGQSAVPDAKRKTPEVRALEEKLRKHLGTAVKIKDKGKTGSITIEYKSLDELDRLLDILI